MLCNSVGCYNCEDDMTEYVISMAIYKSEYNIDSYTPPQKVILCDSCCSIFHGECFLCNELMLDEWIYYNDKNICRFCINDLRIYEISDDLRCLLDEYENIQELLESEYNDEINDLLKNIVMSKLVQKESRELINNLDNINEKKYNTFKLGKLFPDFSLEDRKRIADKLKGKIDSNNSIQFILSLCCT